MEIISSMLAKVKHGGIFMSYGKNRQWCAILYPENMAEDWQETIAERVQLPYAYCIHDKGLELENGEHRKPHVHVILVWPSPTTENHAKEVFSSLDALGRRAFSTVQPVYNAQRAYDYLIHDTDDARKAGKYQFDRSKRIVGNNYDIGAYVQVSTQEKNEIFDQLTSDILKLGIQNFADFIEIVTGSYPDRADVLREVIRGHSAYFERLIKGVWQREGSPEMMEKSRRSGQLAGDHRPARR